MLDLIFTTLLVIGAGWVIFNKCKEIIATSRTKSKWFNIATLIFFWGLYAVCMAGLLYVYIDVYICPLPPVK